MAKNWGHLGEPEYSFVSIFPMIICQVTLGNLEASSSGIDEVCAKSTAAWRMVHLLNQKNSDNDKMTTIPISNSPTFIQKLENLCMKQKLKLPTFKPIEKKTSGTEHQSLFHVTCTVEDYEVVGVASRLRTAKRIAIKLMIEKLTEKLEEHIGKKSIT